MRFFHVIGMVLALLISAGVARAEIRVLAAVDQQEVFTGEAFSLQIHVEGNDTPGEPDVTPLSDFTVEPRGGQENSSESVTIVNGQMSRVSRHGYVYNYVLTPKKEGRLIVPALTVAIEGRDYQTQPIPILVKKPVETEDFKLRMTLDKTRVYQGEPLTLTVTWYIGKDVKGFNVTLPILSDPRFVVSDGTAAAVGPAQDSRVRIPVPGGEILAEKGNGVLDGVNYLTVSFSRTLTPKESGTLTLPQATVSCQALSGYRQGRRDPFSGLFPEDIFGRSRQVYQTVVVPSNEPVLEVMPLPEEGRPADFNGLVGAYSLAVSATPTTVKVGDPITLTIQVAGPAVAGVTLPSLAEELGVSDFKVPAEMAPGQGTGVLKTFTQTVRARHAGVKQIPSLHLSYFDPASGRYQNAASEPVPLAVAETRTVTAQDAEGGADAARPAGKDLKSVKGGITFNYEGPEVLEDQAGSGTAGLNAAWYAALLLPPLLFLLVLVGTLVVRQGLKDPAGRAARQAFRKLAFALDGISSQGDPLAACQGLGLAMRDYLGAKLHCRAAALTFADVEPRLTKAGAQAETLGLLRRVMEECAASEYAGLRRGGGDLVRLRDLARQAATELERVL